MIGDEFQGKMIHHTIDNDCTTDEEQIFLAVRNLHNSLRNGLREEERATQLAQEQLSMPGVVFPSSILPSHQNAQNHH
jgi:hypothetical protein